jgi:hypothetical protein
MSLLAGPDYWGFPPRGFQPAAPAGNDITCQGCGRVFRDVRTWLGHNCPGDVMWKQPCGDAL